MNREDDASDLGVSGLPTPRARADGVVLEPDSLCPTDTGPSFGVGDMRQGGKQPIRGRQAPRVRCMRKGVDPEGSGVNDRQQHGERSGCSAINRGSAAWMQMLIVGPIGRT